MRTEKEIRERLENIRKLLKILPSDATFSFMVEKTREHELLWVLGEEE